MNAAERFRQARAIFERVCECPPARRETLLREVCGHDPELRAEVEAALAHDTATAALVDAAAGGAVQEALAAAVARGADDAPEWIGAYRIVRRVGAGGMGVVYEAEQQSPKRRVALKMVRPSHLGEQLRRRLQREAEVLGRLQHPGIAQVYEAGIVERDGEALPFFAMEFVAGSSITAFASAQELTVRQRLALLARVCDAVHHAHQMGVIHRDLKPANILVVQTDPDSGPHGAGSGGRSTTLDVLGAPKVLDFGIARVTEGDVQAATVQTDVGQLVGTLAYMSPEQVAGDPTRLDARCDVYTLGVVLFELLTGRLPLDLTGRPVPEAARMIRDDEPLAAASIDRSLRGDVDTILATALEKDPGQRYASAAALAADIRRHLEDEPIVARPPSAIYNLRKFARRNQGLVTGLGAAFVLLLLGTVGTGLGLAAALRANRELAQTNAALAESNRQLEQANTSLAAVSAFQSAQLTELDVPLMGLRLRAGLLEAAPGERRTALAAALAGVNFVDVALRSLEQNLFERALQAIAEQFAGQPALQAALLQDLATTMREIGLLHAAVAPQQRALELRRHALGDEHDDTLDSVHEAGHLDVAHGHHHQAADRYRAALAHAVPRYGEDAGQTLGLRSALAGVLAELGDYEQAERLARRSLEGLAQQLGPDHPETLVAQEIFANALNRLGQYEESERLFRAAYERRRALLGDEHARTIGAQSNLSVVLENLGRYDEATALTRAAFDAQVRMRGSDHPQTLKAMLELGVRMSRHGQLAEAEPLLREALARRRNLLGDDHDDTHTAIEALASLLDERGQFAESEALFGEALERRRHVLGADHPATIRALGNLGFIINQQGRAAEAEPYYRETLAALRRVYGDEHPHTLTSIGNLAALLSGLNRYEEAEPLYHESLAGRRRTLGPDHPSTLNAVYGMGDMLQRRGRLDEAEPFCEQALAGYRRVGGDDHIGTLFSLTNLGRLRLAQGRPADAAPLFLEAVERRRRVNGDDHPQTAVAAGGLAEALEAQQEWEDAGRWRHFGLEAALRRAPHDAPAVADAQADLARNLTHQGRPQEAEALLRESLEALSEVNADWRKWRVQSLLGAAIAADPARAAEAERLLSEALDGLIASEEGGDGVRDSAAEARRWLEQLRAAQQDD